MYQAPDTQIAEGLPKPPYWLRFLQDALPPDEEATNKQDFYATVPLDELHKRFPPPPIPTGTFTCFGAPIQLDELPVREILDTDTKCFRDTPDVNGVVPDLKDEFSRLMELMLDDIGHLIGQCSQLGDPNVTGSGSTAKNVIRLYKNLHNILAILREYQFYETIVKRLEVQFQQRLRLVNDVRQVAFNLPPISRETVEASIRVDRG